MRRTSIAWWETVLLLLGVVLPTHLGVAQSKVGVAAAGSAPVSPPAVLDDLSAQLVALANKVEPAVVQVAITTGWSEGRSEVGSGVVVSSDGYIVTTAHVVADADKIAVLLPTPADAAHRSVVAAPPQRVPARLVGIDAESDLALLKVERSGLPVLPLGNSEVLRRGQLVLACGSPLGFAGSVSLGVVSAPARQLTVDSSMIYVQTDAAINPGSSGGPLVTLQGEVVGINTLIASGAGGSAGLGFAVPSNIVKTVVEQLRSQGFVRRGGIGVHVQTITPDLARALRLSRATGVIIADVVPNGPAEFMKLKVGDIVLRLGDKAMENARQFAVNLYRHRAGERVKLTLQRGNQQLTVQVPVAEATSEVRGNPLAIQGKGERLERLGIVAVDLNADALALMSGFRSQRGVLVAPGGVPGLLFPGDLLLSVNNKATVNLREAKAALATIPPSEPVAVQIERQGQLLYLLIEAGAKP